MTSITPTYIYQNQKINIWSEARMIRMTAFNDAERDNNNFTQDNLLKAFGANDEGELFYIIKEYLSEIYNISIEQWLEGAYRRKAYEDKLNGFIARSNGFPIDTELFVKIFSNARKIVQMAVKEANNIIPGCFTYNPKFKNYSTNNDVIANYLGNKDFKISDFKNNPVLEPIYTAQSTITCLLGKASKSLPKLLKDGYIRANDNAYGVKTGRNNPKLTEGFILSANTWIRTLIKPKEGYSIIKLDWTGQEAWVAGVLTDDKKMIDGYATGDIYSYTAKNALGIMPQDGDRYTHPTERDIAKIFQLAISYGQGVKAISRRLDNAQQHYDNHKKYYHQYWDWVAANKLKSVIQGYYQTNDGWLYFTKDINTGNKTDKVEHLLSNAPFQSEAAGLMRETVMLMDERIDIIATHYDALYISCRTKDVDITKKYVEQIMNQAAMNYFSTTSVPFIEPEVITGKNYMDKRGQAFYDRVQQIM